ncbi:hypothetical protein ES332_A11G031200v1 [Gossypium tomentosum]|uniref:RNA helicase n=1 Tax=Gossypium tomentosum TaxID=34277 RepID=A0A5D2N4R2_GOSTO|nr:hypothetical protein ES332_A11G031200v1 [Gossypium tomentosum]
MEAIKTFKVLALCEELVEACDEISWKTPTKIQADAMPHALEGNDLIGPSQTGTGRTAAFTLPILHALLECHSKQGYKCAPVFFALVLSQTRSAIKQRIDIACGSNCIWNLEFLQAKHGWFGLKCAVLVGGVELMQQQIALGKQPHIIVGTPGRLMDHLTNTKGFSLSMLKYLADKLLNEDFEKALHDILCVWETNILCILKKHVHIPFSVSNWMWVKKLQRACLRNPVKIEAAQKYSTVDTLKQHYRFVAAKNKDCFHVYILIQMSGCTSIVFTRTCDQTRLLSLLLRDRNVKAVFISGQMTQANRLESLNKFKSGQYNVLVCTDVAGRGLDIPSVDMVHIHQVGRTARAGRSGLAISRVNQYELEEEVMQYYEEVADSRRKAQTKLKEMGGTRRRRGRDDSDDDIGRYLTIKG